jgi:hypothetical protein
LHGDVEYFPQGLEDQFDRKSRERLDGFIVSDGPGLMSKEPEKREETEIVQHSQIGVESTWYYVAPLADSAGEVEERRTLVRLPIFAIFHGIAHQHGVPPSFTGTSTLF